MLKDVKINFEDIVGENIRGISVVIWDDKAHPITIERILIEFENNKLLIDIDKDYDEIIIKIDESLILEATEDKHIVISLNKESDFDLKALLDGRIIWTWTLNNNRGSDDAFQLEIEKDKERCTCQFLAIGSQIKIYKLGEIVYLP